MKKIFLLLFLFPFVAFSEMPAPILRTGSTSEFSLRTPEDPSLLKNSSEVLFISALYKLPVGIELFHKIAVSVALNYNASEYAETLKKMHVSNYLRIRGIIGRKCTLYMFALPDYGFADYEYRQRLGMGILFKYDHFRGTFEYTNYYLCTEELKMTHTFGSSVYWRTGSHVYHFHQLRFSGTVVDTALVDSSPPYLSSIKCGYEFRMDFSKLFDEYEIPIESEDDD